MYCNEGMHTRDILNNNVCSNPSIYSESTGWVKITHDASIDEFVLPDRWCIQVTKENVDIITKWKRTKGCQEYAGNWKRVDHTGNGFNKLNNGDPRIEITFDQFKKYVLKENTNEMKLKTNTWYQNQYDKDWYVYRTGNHDNVGFDCGEWTTDNPCFTTDGGWKESPKEEIEKLLINEAKKRYLLGETIIKSNYDNNDYKLHNVSPIKISKEDEDPFGIRGGGAKLYANGKWAEVVETPKEVFKEEFKIGDFVITKGYSKDYDGRLLEITRISKNKLCYFRVYDGGYYYSEHNFHIIYILRKATQDEINSVLQKTSQHSKGEAMDFFAANPKSLMEQKDPNQYQYNIKLVKQSINMKDIDEQPIQLKKVKAIINKVKKY